MSYPLLFELDGLSGLHGGLFEAEEMAGRLVIDDLQEGLPFEIFGALHFQEPGQSHTRLPKAPLPVDDEERIGAESKKGFKQTALPLEQEEELLFV